MSGWVYRCRHVDGRREWTILRNGRFEVVTENPREANELQPQPSDEALAAAIAAGPDPKDMLQAATRRGRRTAPALLAVELDGQGRERWDAAYRRGQQDAYARTLEIIEARARQLHTIASAIPLREVNRLAAAIRKESEKGEA